MTAVKAQEQAEAVKVTSQRGCMLLHELASASEAVWIGLLINPDKQTHPDMQYQQPQQL